uniref:Colipase like 2 n=1 Tax=Piliocolobus tephrosceles TaxID=591936 RepID=A0A8C9I8Y1_9PRIM
MAAALALVAGILAGAVLPPWSALPQYKKDLKEICIRNQDCQTGCCRRSPDICESHCAENGSEGSPCQTQAFFSLYRECPCLQNLTCVHWKNEKWSVSAYGRCQKIGRQKLAKKMFF